MLASLSEDRSAETACTAELPEADLTASAASCAFSAFLQPIVELMLLVPCMLRCAFMPASAVV